MATAPKITAFSFNAANVKPAALTDPLPKGWYNCVIKDAEIKPTAGRSAGKQVHFQYEVLNPDFKGRIIFDKVTIENANAQAVQIGNEQLSAICHATGLIAFTDFAQFIGKTLVVKVKIEVDEKGKYDDKNKATGWKPMDGATAAPAMPGFASAGGPPPVATAPPPVMPPAALPPPPMAPPAPPAPAPTFPPAGWVQHPQSAAHWWNQATNEVKTTEDLQTCFAATIAAAPFVHPAPVAAPPAPVIAPPPAVLPPPPAPVAAPFPPAGWTQHPQSPAHYYNAAGEVKTAEELQAMPAGEDDIPPWVRAQG